MKIIQEFLPKDQYVDEDSKKTQIVLHHTVSGVGVAGDINWWLKDKSRVGTHYIIARDGQIYQMLPDEKWIYHLGLSNKDFSLIGIPYKQLEKNSIGIELDSYGWLKRDGNGRILTGYKTIFPGTLKAVEVSYRGFTLYEEYYEPQLQALKELLLHLCSVHGINKAFNEKMFEVNKSAMTGVNGIWSHGSYRRDKTDVYPSPSLIEMLKSL